MIFWKVPIAQTVGEHRWEATMERQSIPDISQPESRLSQVLDLPLGGIRGMWGQVYVGDYYWHIDSASLSRTMAVGEIIWSVVAKS